MEKILVVEDDRAVQNALKRLFASNGYSVEIAATGTAALNRSVRRCLRPLCWICAFPGYLDKTSAGKSRVVPPIFP